MDMEGILARGQELVAAFGIKAITALLILVAGRWVAGSLRNVTAKVMGRNKVDPTLITFVGSLVYFAILTFVALAALAQLGIQTTSFIAVLGAAGLAVGLALQGSLANLAAGVLMLIFRPFKVGDYIEGAGVAGVVEEIHIFTTMLSTLDNKAIIIPNAKLTGDNITNYTRKDRRRIDMVFSVAYGSDIETVKRAIAGGAVEFAVRPWVRTDEYWNVFFDTNENIKKRFDADGIRGPVPQREVRVHQA
jgi:small conductance mechanosensitive channel